MQYFSLQQWTLLSPPDISTTGQCCHFGLAFSFLLELFLYSSSVAYWTPCDLEGSFSGVISFCLFILFMRFTKQEYWSGLPFPPQLDHIWSELFTMVHLSWVALHSMAHSFSEFHRPLCPDKAVTHEGVYIFRESIWKKARGLVLNECLLGEHVLFLLYFLFLSQLCLGS